MRNAGPGHQEQGTGHHEEQHGKGHQHREARGARSHLRGALRALARRDVLHRLGEGCAEALALNQRHGHVAQAVYLGAPVELLEHRAAVRANPKFGLHLAELRGEVLLDGHELGGDRDQSSLEGKTRLQAHHHEVERIRQRAGHPALAPGDQRAQRVLRQDAADDEARERNEGHQRGVRAERVRARGLKARERAEQRCHRELGREKVRQRVALRKARLAQHRGELLALRRTHRHQQRADPRERKAEGARPAPALNRTVCPVMRPQTECDRLRSRYREAAVEVKRALQFTEYQQRQPPERARAGNQADDDETEELDRHRCGPTGCRARKSRARPGSPPQ